LCSKLISVKLEVDGKNNKGKIAEWLLWCFNILYLFHLFTLEV
jgi:hypothetical protein